MSTLSTYKVLLLTIVLVLQSCETEYLIQPLQTPASIDSFVLVGPDSLVLGDKGVYQFIASGTLPHQFTYEWNVLDAPAKYSLSTTRDSFDYIASDTGLKTVTVALRDRSMDKIVASTEKPLFVFLANDTLPQPLVDSIIAISFTLQTSLALGNYDNKAKHTDTSFRNITLEFPLNLAVRIRKDTIIEHIDERKVIDYIGSGRTESGVVATLRLVPNFRGDTIKYLEIDYSSFSSTRGENNNSSYSDQAYKIILKDFTANFRKDSAGSIVHDFGRNKAAIESVVHHLEYKTMYYSNYPDYFESISLQPLQYDNTNASLLLRFYSLKKK